MTDRICTRASFVRGRQGLLFQIRSALATLSDCSDAPTVLMVPPLAEELNRSRRFLTLLRLAVAERGASFVMLDLFGTGDSDGEFVDARWSTWCGDLRDELSRLMDHATAEISLVGLRSGCLVAADVRRQIGNGHCRMVNIQPESSGSGVLKRWLRARVAAGRFSGSRIERHSELMTRLAAGESLVLGGYTIHPLLAEALQATVLVSEERLQESGADSQDDVIMLSGATDIAPMPEDAANVTFRPYSRIHTVPGRPFWQLQEHEPEPTVVARIAKILVP